MFGVIRQVFEPESHSAQIWRTESHGGSVGPDESSRNTAWARNSRFEFDAVRRVCIMQQVYQPSKVSDEEKIVGSEVDDVWVDGFGN